LEAEYPGREADAVKRICVVCEGQTEETFVRDVLAPNFYPIGLNLIPELIQTSSGYSGGALNYDRVKRHLRNTLRQSSAPIVTTFFDLYRLDRRFPGYEESLQCNDLPARLDFLNDSLSQDVVAEVGCSPRRFIAHIQPYEFEALLFSDVDVLTSIERAWRGAAEVLTEVRRTAESPEHINDRPDTKPSSHLQRELKNPSYRKRLHGPMAAGKIGLSRIESECRFFASWIARLRALSD
jgi:hypothetical protein